MNSRIFFLASPFALFFALAPAVHAEPIVGLTSDSRLLTFDSLTPSTITNTATITGLVGGESLVGIDLRPRDATVYGLGRSSSGAGSIYTLAAATGVATRIAGLSATRPTRRTRSAPCRGRPSVSTSIPSPTPPTRRPGRSA